MTITATPSTAPPTPHVDVVVTAIPAGAATITVTSTASGERTIVRGGSAQKLGGATSFAITDYAAPFGVPITYTATTYSAAGAVTSSEQVTTAPIDINVGWISDPLAPGVSAAVPWFDDASFGFTYARGGGAVPIAGTSLPVAVTDIRQAASDIPLGLIALESLQAFALRTVLLSADPFLLRLPPAWGLPLPGAVYLTADGIGEAVIPKSLAGQPVVDVTLFSMTASRVAPQVANVIVPPRTYQTVLNEAGTYSNLLALRPTYLNVLTGA